MREDDLVHGVPPIAVSRTTTRENRTGSWKRVRPVYRDRVAPCAQGCPVGIDIPGYMRLLREGREAEAADLLLRENPMPAVTGRVCHHPCESACHRGAFDGAVSIHAVERTLGDRARLGPFPEGPPPARHERIAVVGSGPAGLACAYFGARLGYAVTVFEADAEPGGVLRRGIPEYRLPREVLDGEIDRLRALGVKILCREAVGVQVDWEELERFDAVFLATGVPRSRALGIEGEGLPGVRPGLAFLREVNGGVRPDVGRRVVVVGGGNTAMDCARTALRLGAAVTVVYRRTRAEMPAIEEEVAEGEREGVTFRFLAAPVAVQARDGRLAGLLCRRMRLDRPDASGRPRPVPVEGSEFLEPADTILTAVGEGPDFEGWPPLLRHDDAVVETDGGPAPRRPGYFAGGDITDQPHTVAHALGSGKRAALAIDRYLRGGRADDEALRFGARGNTSFVRYRGDDPVPRTHARNEVVPLEAMNTASFAPVARHADAHLEARRGSSGFDETNRGLLEDEARDEAARCFACGTCNRCELCLIYCPDVAIRRRPDGLGFEIDDDHCKGCGLCVAECPRGAMAMVQEGV